MTCDPSFRIIKINDPSPALISVLLCTAAAAFTYRSRKSPMRCKSTFTCDLPLSLFVKDSHAEIHIAAHTPVSQPVNGFSAGVRDRPATDTCSASACYCKP